MARGKKQLKKNYRNIKLFPYRCVLGSGVNSSFSHLRGLFDKKNVSRNVIKYHADYPLLLVIDDIDGNFLLGRFIKLKKNIPLVMNSKTGSEHPANILQDENIEEMSHFIWNVNDKILLGEYNFEAVRFFHIPLKFYFDKVFGDVGNVVKPLVDFKTFDNFKKSKRGIKTVTVRIPQERFGSFEKRTGYSPIPELFVFSSDKETQIEIVIKKTRKRNVFLEKDKIMEAVKHLRTGNIVEGLTVETQDSVYDLINDNFLCYYIRLEENGRMIDSRDFYAEAQRVYEVHILEIKRVNESND